MLKKNFFGIVGDFVSLVTNLNHVQTFIVYINCNYLYKPLQDDTTTYFTFDTIERDFFVIFQLGFK